MRSTDNRNLFTTLIGAAASGDNIHAIPATQATPGSGLASIALGYPAETFVSHAAGGVPPFGQDANGFLNLLSAAIQSLQADFFGPYNSTFASAINGYPLNAIVSAGVAGAFLVSTAENNLTVPGATGASWQDLFSGLLKTSAAFDVTKSNVTSSTSVNPIAYETIVTCENSGAITITLGAGSFSGQIVTILGSGAGAVSVVSTASSGNPFFIFPDQTTSYSWTIGSAYGAGITLIWDGTNYRAVTFGNAIVANATASNQAVALGQAFHEIAPTGTTTITPTALRTVVQPSITAASTITINPGSVVGQEVVVYGNSAAAVTVASSAASGSPVIFLPDFSAYNSYTLPLNPIAAIVLTWDGANWRCRTIGQEIVANATASNQAVALGQFPNSLSSAGYQKLPSGLIIQWVYISVSSNAEGTRSITWPVSFPNACLSIQLTVETTTTSTAADWGAQVVSKSTGGATVYMQNMGNAAPANYSGLYAITIGY